MHRHHMCVCVCFKVEEVLKVKNISKKYQAKNGEVNALDNISFSVNKGEFISIIGPSRLWKIYSLIYNCRFGRCISW